MEAALDAGAEDIRDVIMVGRVNQMPAQSDLSEDKIRTLVAYVMSLGT